MGRIWEGQSNPSMAGSAEKMERVAARGHYVGLKREKGE